ncbi:MAG: ABC transporter permease [Acetatifactor sp.]|nr:ABC transporter permease [Acetatifactor sp.]
MKKIRITKQKIIRTLICIAFAIVALTLHLIRNGIIEKQVSQQMAERWHMETGAAQISCFFTSNAGVTANQIIGFEHSLDSALQEASITLENEEEGSSARLWSDAYSAKGSVMLSTKRATISAKAIGVGGDFFQFHPMDLEYGNYFSDGDVNKDLVVIDEEIAWQLFGGINVTGKIIDVGGQPHLIVGVIKRHQGKMEQNAGLTDSIIYMSYESLEQHGSMEPISHFEIVMPNPIKGFAMDMVKDKLSVNQDEVVMVENTKRFSYERSLKHLKEFPYRSMTAKAIIYPYWENLARGYEDIVALYALFVVLFSAVPAIALLILIIQLWRHKKWTAKSICEKIGDKIYQLRANLRNNRRSKKRAPININFDEEEKNEKVE